MKKLLSVAVGAFVASAIATSSAFATYDFGQLGSGDIYRVRNVSDNQMNFEKTANADLCETVQFKIRVHNAGPKTLKNVKIKATLNQSVVGTTHSSTATITADNNRENATATGATSVNLSQAGKISYVAGSTQLLDTNGSELRNLGDSLFTSGVNIGDVAVSLNNMRFVQFKAKFNCEEPTLIKVCELASKKIVTIDEKNFDDSKHSKDLADCAAKPPVPGEIVVCETATKEIVTIKENEFDSSKYTKDLSVCDETPETPAELPQTGAEGAFAIVVALLTAGAAYIATARRNVLG
jgi:uncharacterized repeat protein (TIGR01451 family)